MEMTTGNSVPARRSTERLLRAPCSVGGRVGPDVYLTVLNPLEGSPHGYLSNLRSFPALLGPTTQAKLVFVTSAQENFSTSQFIKQRWRWYLSFQRQDLII